MYLGPTYRRWCEKHKNAKLNGSAFITQMERIYEKRHGCGFTRIKQSKTALNVYFKLKERGYFQEL